MKAGWSFNDIDNADWYGLLSVLSEDDRMSGEEFFNSI
ncbi:hypothetical protein JOD43_002116 [Pullulanibacillus pueri]|nr:hypothetical protein [Pullulanibacillus pueri]